MSIPKIGYPLLVEDCESVPLGNKNGWSLQGYSKAGERTGFKLNPLNILLDCGIQSIAQLKAVFITHSHIDHTWYLSHIAGGVKTNTRTELLPVYFPSQAYEGLTKLLEAATLLSYPKEKFTEKQLWERHWLEPKPLSVGDVVYLNNRKLKIEVLQATHTVHSQGYGFSTFKSKLKTEFEHLKENPLELAKIRKQNVEITEIIEQPEFVFYCDSTIHNLKNYNEWKKYPVVVSECTGFPQIYEKDKINERGHTHLDDFLEIVKENPDKKWFLIHSTMKATKEFLEEKQQELNSLNVNILCKNL